MHIVNLHNVLRIAKFGAMPHESRPQSVSISQSTRACYVLRQDRHAPAAALDTVAYRHARNRHCGGRSFPCQMDHVTATAGGKSPFRIHRIQMRPGTRH
jgi:hypothetical protein